MDVQILRGELRCILYADPVSSAEVRMEARQMLGELKQLAKRDLSPTEFKQAFAL